ncbi:LSU ribosomal protein L22P [Chthonomonas calidirosea]|uniref:50S ribosomal protein L22 n=1 Tax=Chthonomonas calidirosea TaxID=454171 RepID=UPI0006DD4853|nr:LSU ribosomal protein L22P [Chthonomonas calidirosea]
MAEDKEADILERPKTHRENRKKNRPRRVAKNQAMAVAKFVRVPPRKARLVIDEIRGLYAQDALAFLKFVPNRAAGFIYRVLDSAVANAVNNHSLDAERLKVVSARVDEGPRIKRIHPRAQGRVYRILHRTSHITIVVEESEPKPRRVRRATRSRAEAARAARAAKAAEATPISAPETTEAVASVVSEQRPEELVPQELEAEEMELEAEEMEAEATASSEPASPEGNDKEES